MEKMASFGCSTSSSWICGGEGGEGGFISYYILTKIVVLSLTFVCLFEILQKWNFERSFCARKLVVCAKI